MRYLIVLRGSPGSGKSTWVENNRLEPYTLSSDKIRMMISSLELTATGQMIPQVNKEAWKLLFELLEKRMQDGQFTVVDATHTKPKDMNRYQELANEYRYRIIIVQFDTPIEIAKRWNKQRSGYKILHNDVIDRMYKRMKKSMSPKFEVIKPIDFEKTVRIDPTTLEEYENVHFIGDVHGCYTVLMNHFEENPMNDKDYYIFIGDLCDRGIENDKVIEFALSLKKKPNVAFLWGNHEQWLWNWTSIQDDELWITEREIIGKAFCSENVFLPKEFVNGTLPQLQKAKINKNELRRFLRTFKEVMWFQHKGKMFLVTHAGISHLNIALPYISSKQFIKGVGTYGDPVDQWFTDSLEEADPVYQVHGHRNKKNLPIQAANKSFTLENKIEFGGFLRVLTHKGNGEFQAYEIINKVYNKNMKNKWT